MKDEFGNSGRGLSDFFIKKDDFGSFSRTGSGDFF